MRTTIQFFLSLLTFAVLLWAVWQGYLLLNNQYVILDAGTQSLITIVTMLITVCTFVIASAIRNGARAVALGQQHRGKAELYETFLLVCHSFIRETDPERKAAIEQSILDLKTAIALRTSQPVIKALHDLLMLFRSETTSTVSVQAALEKLLLAMRQDLGQANYPTTKQDLAKMLTSLK